jgi:predicted O-methyltransferase YrrM
MVKLIVAPGRGRRRWRPGERDKPPDQITKRDCWAIVGYVEMLLNTPQVRAVLDRMYIRSAERDAEAKQALPADPEVLDTRQRADILKDAPLAITRQVGELLYALALARRARLIVEFGASQGASSIHLAAAARGCGDGALVTTEIQPEKARVAAENLEAAGLRDVVEIRIGDALQTLRELPGAVDVLFLDGPHKLYLPVLQIVEPQLAPNALVVADYSKDDPTLVPYQEYVRDPSNGYFSTLLPLDDGVELSVRV